MQRYQKPALSFDQQLALLESRGLIVADRESAKAVLMRISYYRFSAYAFPWRQQGIDTFRPGASFETVVHHYEFDRVLRNLVWEAIEPVEVMLRTRVTHHLATTYGTFAHLDHRNFSPTNPRHGWDHAKWLANVEVEADRSHELFVQAFKKKYEGFPQLPLWMATEIMSLGSLSKLYGAMHTRDQRPIARELGVHETIFPSWVHTLTTIRNACAHHNRLWDQGLGVKPALPQKPEWQPKSLPHKDRIGCVLFMLNHQLRTGNVPCRDSWRQRVEAHLAPLVSNPEWRSRMGVPTSWPSHPLWI